jgi:beta-lactamase regulating signal transducer with metallopeptidase domain
VAELAETPNAGSFTTLQIPYWWPDAVAAIWLSGSFLWFTRIGVQVVRFQRLLRHSVAAPPDLQERAKLLASRLRLRRAPTVWLVPGNVSPMIWALAKTPRVLFPARLLGELDAERRDALLAHELAHVYRCDHWVRFVEVLGLGLYWWHPVAWWARRELREAEEQCCDAWAVWLLAGAARTYALALLQTVEFFSKTRPTLPMAASGIGQVTHLRRRLTMIMHGKTPRSLSPTGCLLVMGVGALLFIRLPLQAQQRPSATSQREKSSTDEQINALKQAIDVLQQQKSAEEKANAKEKTKEIDHLRSLVAAQEKRVNELRRNLANAEALLSVERERLDRLSGTKKEGSTQQPLQFSGPGGPLAARAVYGLALQQKSGSFEERLDRILKEIDELRKEIRGQKSAGAAIDAPSLDQGAVNHAAYNNEAWNIAISADTKPEEARKALDLARKACEMTDWKNGYYLDTLAAAHARLGQFDEAVKWQEKALDAGDLGPETEPGRERLKLYKDHKPYNQPSAEEKKES